jgi:hypothetical protein
MAKYSETMAGGITPVRVYGSDLVTSSRALYSQLPKIKSRGPFVYLALISVA